MFIVDASTRLRHIPFKTAGSCSSLPRLQTAAGKNLEFCGHLDSTGLSRFYDNSRLIVVPSICYEGFPSTILEAMIRGKAVVCSRTGGLAEIVEDGRTGLLFEPGNTEDLIEKIQRLWDYPDRL